MLKIIYLLSITLLFNSSCTKTRRDEGLAEEEKSRCIQDRFAQNQANNLYGLNCIQGKRLFVKSSRDGEAVSTTKASESLSGGLIIEEDVDFINQFYDLSYEVLQGKGDDKKSPYLLDFLPTKEPFFGMKNTEYEIVFQLEGDHLVLFQASKDKKNLPYTHWSSLKEEGDYYMAPFIGYYVEYCSPKPIRNSQGEEGYENIADCSKSHLQNAKYIRVTPKKKPYTYWDKTDVFPSDYFEGEWFFSEGHIETVQKGELEELEVNPSFLVTMVKEPDQLVLTDASVSEQTGSLPISTIPVNWLDFEMAQDSGVFKPFGEIKDENQDDITRPYIQIDFSRIQGNVIEFLIGKNYFSYVSQVHLPLVDEDGNKLDQNISVKWKRSYLRKRAFENQNFKTEEMVCKGLYKPFWFDLYTSNRRKLESGKTHNR